MKAVFLDFFERVSQSELAMISLIIGLVAIFWLFYVLFQIWYLKHSRKGVSLSYSDKNKAIDDMIAIVQKNIPGIPRDDALKVVYRQLGDIKKDLKSDALKGGAE